MKQNVLVLIHRDGRLEDHLYRGDEQICIVHFDWDWLESSYHTDDLSEMLDNPANWPEDLRKTDIFNDSLANLEEYAPDKIPVWIKKWKQEKLLATLTEVENIGN